jgi:hypothetical protein
VDHRVDLLDCDGGLCFLRHGRERLFKNSSDEKPPSLKASACRGGYWLMETRKADLTRDFPIARSPHHATNRQSGSDQSTRRRPRTPCCGERSALVADMVMG